jgi:hypothetical protein
MQCTQEEARRVTFMSVLIMKVAERKVQMGGFKITCYSVIHRQGTIAVIWFTLFLPEHVQNHN